MPAESAADWLRAKAGNRTTAQRTAKREIRIVTSSCTVGLLRYRGNDCIRDHVVPEPAPNSVVAIITCGEYDCEVELGDDNEKLSSVPIRLVFAVGARPRFERVTVPGVAVAVIDRSIDLFRSRLDHP